MKEDCNMARLDSVITKVYTDNMIRTQISFDADLYAKAKELARTQGISLAELCRRAVEDVIARQASDRSWMAFAGILDGKKEDSCVVDDVVYGRVEP